MASNDSLESLLAAARKNARERMGKSSTQEKGKTYSPGEVILGAYRVLSNPLQGGMGSVWKVRHLQWNTDLAMKQPKAEYFIRARDRENFIRECEVWIDLGLHPNIVSCYYVREIDGVPSIFSEWMDSGSLRDQIESGSLYTGSPEEDNQLLLRIAIQTARGLRYAHEKGLIHQDVKPANILLSMEDDGLCAKIADFGLSKALARLTALEGIATAAEGASIYSPTGGYTREYCSMEQLNGEILTRRTDIFSWAVSVLEMYLGERRWKFGIAAAENCEEYFPQCRVPMPGRLQALLKECLSNDSEARPHDFALVEERLMDIYTHDFDFDSYDIEAPLNDSAKNVTAQVLNNRALSYIDLGKTDRALEIWQDALAQDFTNEEAVFNYALSRWRKGQISPEDARNELNYIPNPERVEALSDLLSRESLGKIQLNLPDNWEALPDSGENPSVPAQYLPQDPDMVRSADLSPYGDLAVVVKKDGSVNLYGKGEQFGIFQRKLKSFDDSNFYLAVFLSSARYVCACTYNSLCIWETDSGKLLRTDFDSSAFRSAYRKCAGSYWQLREAGKYLSGESAEYLLSKTESSIERIRKEKGFALFLSLAQKAYEEGDAEKALAFLDTAAAYPGAANSLKIAELRAKYAGNAHKLGVKDLIFLNENAPEKPESLPLPDSTRTKRLMPRLCELEREFLRLHRDEEDADYETHTTPLFASPDGSVNVYEISVWEYYDNPYQGEETTVWRGLAVFDGEDRLLYKNDSYHIRTPYGSSQEPALVLSPDRKSILCSGEKLQIFDLESGFTETISESSFGPVALTPDSRWILNLEARRTLRVYEVETLREVYSRQFPRGQCTDVYALDDFYLALNINGSARRCYLTWHYDFANNENHTE